MPIGDEREHAELAIKTVCHRIRTNDEEVTIGKMTKTFCVPGLLFLNGAIQCGGLKPMYFHTDADKDRLLEHCRLNQATSGYYELN